MQSTDMICHAAISKAAIKIKIRRREIFLAGNAQLKIYGTLQCKSGKRMKKENRVFFVSENEAIKQGYRPCGHCMKTKYQQYRLSGVFKKIQH